MTDENPDQDAVGSRRAAGIVAALADDDGFTCSDCGEEVDVSDAETEMEVVAALADHQQESHE